MALLPYALRPRSVLRRTALKRGVRGESLLWSSVAGLLVGQGAYVRTQAIRRGVIGGSRGWQVLAGLLVAKEVLGSAGKQPEQLGKVKVARGSFVRVAAEKPLTRKQAKQAGITKQLLAARASADIAASWAAKAERKPSRKNISRAEKTATMAAAAERKAAKRAS